MRIIHFSVIFFLTLIFLFQSFARQGNGLNAGSNQKQFDLQWKENGLPYIQNFSPTDYNAEIQNFSIVQDKRGLIYFGNNKGILIYDGVFWRLIPTANKTLARSLCLINDTVYVGAEGDFGYLKPDTSGKLKFVSLLNLIPEQYRDFHDVYEIISNNDTTYIRTRNYLFRLHYDKVKVWSSNNQFDAHFLFNNTMFVEQHGVGLSKMINDTLLLLPGGKLFAEKRISRMFPYDKTRFIISTFSYGLFIYDGEKIRKFRTEADNLLLENKIFFGRKISSGFLAFGTGHGVVILDKNGRLCQVVNKSSGLRNELVLNIFVDKQQGLWLALNNGIARVETPSPYSRFKDISGMDSFVESIISYNGILYSTSERGIYYLDKDEFPFPKFKPVSGINTLSFSLITAANKLLAGTQSAVYEINGTKGTKISDLPSKRLFHSRIDTDRVYVTLIEGFAGLERVDNKWIEIPPVPGINLRIIAVAENPDGTLWLGSEFEGLFKADIKMEFLNRHKPQMNVSLLHYGEKDGLPPGQIIPVSTAGRTVFATMKGLKYFNTARKLFLPDTTFGKIFADSLCEIDFMSEDNNRDVWIITKKGGKTIPGLILPLPNGRYAWQENIFSRINDLGNSYVIYPEENGTVWIGGSEGIARYFPGIGKNGFNFSALIRKVTGISADSAFYNGNIYSNFSKPEFEHKNNSLRFEFSATSYDDPADNLFQVMLEGYDKNWSNWFSKTDKDYTGLPAGEYVFHVHAKNIYNQLSSEDTFTFEILPPWFQTWWAYLFYVLSIGAIVFSIVKIRVRQLEKRTHLLENIVLERTATIREQTEKLKELDHLKSRFFANISHEFRTPLTLILGILEKYLKNPGNESSDFNIMKKNARRLLHLINQMLELSKLEAGNVKLQVQKTDLVKFVKRASSSFISLAEQHKIVFTFNNLPVSSIYETNKIFAYIDRDKIETVIYNLLSNAFKFTPDGENISIDISSDINYAEIQIKNTGAGIPEKHLPHIFDRFYQVDDSATRIYEGTGIGLALVKEFAELHHGSVKVESNGFETTFKLIVPLGSKYFTPDQIIDFKEKDAEAIENLLPTNEKAPGIKRITREPPSPETGIILVVEDHFDLRNFICEQLENDYSIVEAEDGEKGLLLAEEIIPDMVISDIMMPNMDGYQLCEKLKSNIKTNHIPVILLTAKASFENKLEGLETGADDYLIKPFNTEELQARVKNLIRIRKQMREKFQSEMILKPMEVIVPSSQKVFIEKLTKIIEENIEDENFSVENLCMKIGMSRTQVHRKVKAITNKSTSEFVRSYRLQKAVDLIKQDAGNMAEIAYMVGFSSQSYFTKSFQDMYGCSPMDYKKDLIK
jgi:signal transduction histidine kinase/DNA-binding response OmpR family regulator/ligand-binding sensor domain-containing protein